MAVADPATGRPDEHGPPGVDELVLDLGRCQLAAGYPVDDVSATLDKVARAYGRPDLNIVVLPDAILVDDPRTGRARAIPQGPNSLRLDQAAVVHEIASQARRGELDPAEGVRELEELPYRKPRFPAWVSILGYGLASAGFALVFRISPWGVAIAALGGIFVGWLMFLTRTRPNLAPLVPPMAAAICSFAIFGFANLIDAGVQPLRVVAAPLITLIPGAALTRSTQELASGHIISGASRLVASIVQILMLVFGVMVGAILARVSPYDISDLTEQRLPLWVAWLGAAVYAIGQAMAFNEPRGALTYVVLLLLLAFSIQQGVAYWVDSVLAAGVAAGVALFVAIVVQDRTQAGIPAFVLFAPVFWLLVPGSLGFVGITQAIAGTDGADASVSPGDTISLDTLDFAGTGDVLLLTGASIIAITIGMQIASIAGRMVRKIPDLPTIPLPGAKND